MILSHIECTLYLKQLLSLLIQGHFYVVMLCLLIKQNGCRANIPTKRTAGIISPHCSPTVGEKSNITEPNWIRNQLSLLYIRAEPEAAPPLCTGINHFSQGPECNTRCMFVQPRECMYTGRQSFLEIWNFKLKIHHTLTDNEGHKRETGLQIFLLSGLCLSFGVIKMYILTLS